MRGAEIRAVWVVAAAVAMVTVPMATAAPSASVDSTAPLLPEPLNDVDSGDDGFELAHEALATSDAGPTMDAKIEQAHRNLDTAEDVLKLLKEERADPLAQTVAIADRMTRWQADSHGFDLSNAPDAPDGSATELAHRMAERDDVTLTSEQADALSKLDDLPGELRTSLADVMAAYIAYDRAAETAYSGLDAERLELAAEVFDERADEPGSTAPATWGALSLDVDLGPVLAARSDLLAAVVSLHAAVDRTQPADGPTTVIPGLLALDLDGQDTTYEEDVALSIDLGGDDTYLNNAGGSNLGDHPCTQLNNLEAYTELGGAAALVDLVGNDTYGERTRGCGVNGGSFLGAGLLLDAAGSDTYRGRLGGVNGAGVFAGVGALVDADGVDVYEATLAGTNGGGMISGLGLLIDYVGDDLYRSRFGTAVNGGSSWESGTGVLVDGDGQDTYRAGSPSNGDRGANGGAIGDGNGFLLDAAGKDTYVTAGSAGMNGGGAKHGVGFLLDAAGSDRYTTGSSGANGGGRHLGLGLLVDLSGSDDYQADGFGSNGGAHRLGHGHLVDVSGNDTYEATYAGANGGGSYGGTAILVDGAGTDTFQDNQGGTGTDVTVVPKGTIGAQIDLPNGPG